MSATHSDLFALIKTRGLFVLRYALGALFIAAAIAKLRDPTQFALEVGNYRLLPAIAPYVAILLPPLELVLGIGVALFPLEWRQAATLLVVLMLAIFSIAVGQAVMRGINIDCGCFGGGSGPVTWRTVGRDLGLLAAALVLLRWDRASVPESEELPRQP